MPYQSRGNNQNNSGNINNNTGNNSTNNTSLPSMKDRERLNREKATSKALGTAAKGAGAYFGGSLGKKAVDMASKTKAGQNLLNKGGDVLNRIPGMGRASKKLDDNGTIDKVNFLMDKGKNKPINENEVVNDGGEVSKGSFPSSVSKNETDNKDTDSPNIAGIGPFPKKNLLRSSEDDDQEQEKKNGKGLISVSVSLFVKVAIIIAIPIIIIIILIVAVLGSVMGGVSDLADAFGASLAAGEEIGDINYEETNAEAIAFYERINNVKLSYQANGRSVDVLKIAAVYHILSSNGSILTYEDMTEDKIREIADCMFSGNTYSEDVFRQNLVDYLIPKYLPNSSDAAREQMVDDIFTYIENYYSFIGKEASQCASAGSCIYDIKGFYISGKGNITKNLSISDLKVRLMQTGFASGHDYGGTWGKPMEGEELVPFEKYILGVAYQEIGPDKSDEAIKAQMVAARSYILARPFDMGGWRKLEQEADGWVLQVAGSTQDQVYCDPDQGCSSPGDGQWGEVYSGLNHGRQIKPPMDANHKMRTLANETMGEVLVNNQGNIIYTSFGSNIQNRMESLARSGLNYKQILLQIYGDLGASDIQKNSCNDGNSSCSSTPSAGPFAGWKQYSGPWVSISLGSSNETIRSAGCLVTSVAMLIAKSGVNTNISDFNPGTFVEYLNSHGGFVGANFVWASATNAAPNFHFQDKISVVGYSKAEKLNILKGLLQRGGYVTAEVKGSTGQHWVAIDGVTDDGRILMMDPGSEATDMWSQYSWSNTSQFAYYTIS